MKRKRYENSDKEVFSKCYLCEEYLQQITKDVNHSCLSCGEKNSRIILCSPSSIINKETGSEEDEERECEQSHSQYNSSNNNNFQLLNITENSTCSEYLTNNNITQTFNVTEENKNRLTFANHLNKSGNIISKIGILESGISQFTPVESTICSKLNLVGVKDSGNKKIHLLDMKGSLLMSINHRNSGEILFIPKLRTLAVVGINYTVEMYDISHLCSNNDKKEIILPILYTIISDHFDHVVIRGMGYCETKGLLALSDTFNKNISIYEITRAGYILHSSISLFIDTPEEIAISATGNCIILLHDHEFSIFMYEKYEGDKIDGEDINHLIPSIMKGKWNLEGKIKPSSSEQLYLTGIALHNRLKYFITCDPFRNQLLFFSLITHDLICSYRPKINSSNFYFKTPYNVCIDEDANLICVTDSWDRFITIFRSPII